MEVLNTSNVQQYACVRCQTRKVKCDRLNPQCSKCVKSNVQCEYKAPAPPNRGKRKRAEADLQSKIQHYETLLKENGVALEEHAPNDSWSPPKISPATSAQTQTEVSPRHAPSDNPAPMTGQAHLTRVFIKDPVPHMGNALWQDLTELRERDDTSSDDEEDAPDLPRVIDHGSEIVLGVNSDQVPTQLPMRQECLRLWQTYLENFHPLTNIVHGPSVDARLNQVLEAPQHITNASMALFTAIFSAAVVTLTNEQCEQHYAESKESMLDRYRKATKIALVRSNLISTTDVNVLLAFVIFIVSAQHDYAHEALWTLVGVAIRIGQRIGLHRTEHLPYLSIFEAEMRRRLWWQICILNSQLGEVTGQTGQRTTLPAEPLLDVAMPANLSDRDLHPDTQTLVPQRKGATQMMFCRIRFEFGVYIRHGYLTKLFVPNTVPPEAMRQTLAEKDKAVDELERIFENKYLRYADPLVPVQLLATIMARAIITRLRFMSHHPRQYTDKGVSLPESEKELVTLLSLKTLEYDGLDAPSLRGFEWHHKNQVHWLALVDVLSELRKCPSGSDSERAWKMVEKIYDTHPEVLRRRKRPLFRALNSMALSAWTKHAADYEQRYGSALQTPGFIATIREGRQRKQQQPPLNQQLPTPDTYVSGDVPTEQTGVMPYTNRDIAHMTDDIGSFNPADMDATLFNPIDWDQWDDMIRDWETQTSNNIFA